MSPKKMMQGTKCLLLNVGVNIKQSISLEKMTELFVDEIFYDASGLYFNEIKSKYKKKE